MQTQELDIAVKTAIFLLNMILMYGGFVSTPNWSRADMLGQVMQSLQTTNNAIPNIVILHTNEMIKNKT